MDKLILIMVCDADKENVQSSLTEHGYTPTLVATTGDFLEYGKSILMVGASEESMDSLQGVLDKNTKTRHIKDGQELKAEIIVMNARMLK